MNILSYKSPASTWTEALPLGNGRIGAMHFGGVEVDRIQLNEDTLWSGPPKKREFKSQETSLAKVRKAIDDGRYQEAVDETKNMFGSYTQAYMPFGDLKLQYLHGNIVRQYERKLDIESALSTVKYQVGEVEYTREAFVSHPHQVFAMKLTSSEAEQLNFMITLDSLLKHQTIHTEANTALQGVCPEQNYPHYYDQPAKPVVYGEIGETKAIHFEGRVAVVSDGKVTYSAGKVLVESASEAVLYFSVATSFNGFDKQPGNDLDELANKNKENLAKVTDLSYEAVKEAHITDYQALFNRMDLQLDTSHLAEKDRSLDTHTRIAKYGATDLEMTRLLFQFGRYLMIASSRPGTQPTNLQGIWNDSTRAPWSSNYTLNINTEMNYWPAEIANLAECHEPLLTAVQELAQSGEKMVKERYGLSGWTANHNTDIWRHTEPVGHEGHGDPSWAYWPMSGPWLTRHLWEHYEFNEDVDYLRDEAYPVMKEAARFCLDWLIEDEDGNLTTSPSTSPEHLFRSEDGQVGSVTKGSTMDLQIIWDLFTNCIAAAEVLEIDAEWIAKVKEAKEGLAPLRIGKEGQLQEWAKDYEDVERNHRHVSHLYGLYPAAQIREEPYLNAVRQSLNIRGDAGTGWSLGWKMNLWARLKDGERIYDLLHQLFNIVGKDQQGMSGGGVYPNLLGAHPPFQIDGNFGYTAGVVEMLVQSHLGYVELLPALPSIWSTGSLTGARVRGGFEVDLTWDKMKVKEAVVSAKQANTFHLKADGHVLLQTEEDEGRTVDSKEGIISVEMKEGQTYTFTFSS